METPPTNGVMGKRDAESYPVKASHDVNNSGKSAYSKRPNLDDPHSQHQHNRLTDEKPHFAEPIAICGIGLRLPAGIRTTKQLWDFLLSKGDARGRVPPSRYNVAAFHDSSARPGTVVTEYGYFLDEELGHLDTTFFPLSRKEVERAAPEQRLMLEVAKECLDDAGEVGWRGKPVGCYMGSFGEDWCEMFARETQHYASYRVTGYGDFALSNRVSYELDLRGPSITTRTACSASTVALHEACLAVLNGDCQSALVGGANLIMTPGLTMTMSEQGVLSPDGSSKSFSGDANGYARGEAITCIFIKKLSDAIRDQNPIRAVIRATGTNSDGKTAGITQPNADAQEALIRKVYSAAGITNYSQTGFVECHATGTMVGDPIEARAVARLFGASGVYIGSVKPNLGHTEGASGLLSIIKAVLSLENRTIAPNIKFTSPNPSIPFKEAKLTVPLQPTPWPHNRIERISVNSFGIGGSNAHVIIDSAASFNISANRVRVSGSKMLCESNKPRLLLYSAASPQSLTAMEKGLRDYVERHPESESDVAYTLAFRREHLSYRAFSIVNKGVVQPMSPVAVAGRAPYLVMVFTGQGAQWPRMGWELLQDNSTFRATIRSLDSYLQEIKRRPSWKIEEELERPGARSRIHAAEFSQPICTAIQIALVDTLASIAIKPAAVIGHSSGEISAAYAAGALTAKEAIKVAFYRGAATTFQKRNGAMAAIGLGIESTKQFLGANTTIACDNSPQSVTISGDADEVAEVLKNVRKSHPDVMARRLQVQTAYHSHHMSEIGSTYEDYMKAEVVGQAPSKLFFSSVTGDLITGSADFGPAYWRRNLESPVWFQTSVQKLLQHSVGDNPLFFEIGPHSTFAGPLRQILSLTSRSAPYISAMTRNQDSNESLLRSIGTLHGHGVSFDLQALIPIGKCLPQLPLYPWLHREKYWYESRLSKEYRQRKHAHHPLLGARLIESTDFEPAWRNLLHLDGIPWLRDHQVGVDVVFPFAGYVAMAAGAVQQVTGVDQSVHFHHIIVSTALVLTEEKPTEMMLTLRQQRLTDTLHSPWWEFTISAHNGHVWVKHCTGEILAEDKTLGECGTPATLPRKVKYREWIGTLSREGLHLGPSFHNFADLSACTKNHIAVARLLNTGEQPDTRKYHLHPTVMDSSFQLLAIAFAKGLSRKHRNWLPFSIEKLSFSRCCSDVVARASAELSGVSTLVGGLEGVSNGVTVLKISGMRMSSTLETSGLDSINDPHAAARLVWGPDIYHADVQTLLSPSSQDREYLSTIEELYRLCLVYAHQEACSSPAEKPYLDQFKSWIACQVDSSPHSMTEAHDNAALLTEIDNVVRKLESTPAASVAAAFRAICTNVNGILAGVFPSLSSILPSSTLSTLYDFFDKCDISTFLRTLGHCKPNMRVLEIGSWRSTPSASILKALELPHGRSLYSKYTFASVGYAPPKMITDRKIKCTSLNLNQDPADQAFKLGQFDLIIENHAVHEAEDRKQALRNIQKLLAPDGHVVLQELCNPEVRWINFIFGVNTNWWGKDSKCSVDEPNLGLQEWRSELESAGLGSIDAVVLDTPEPHQLTATIVARSSLSRSTPKIVTLLCDDKNSNQGPVLKQLEQNGYTVSLCTIYDRPPNGQDIIAVLDRHAPFFDQLTNEKFETFKRFSLQLNGSGVLWATKASQLHCTDPRYTPVIGTARTMRSELLIDFATCEVDSIDESAAQIVDIFARFHARDRSAPLNTEFEYAVKEGVISIPRCYPFALKDQLIVSKSSDVAVLDVERPGRLNTLSWTMTPGNLDSLREDEIEVEVHAVGLNFRDVLVANGIVELPERAFGLEGAGVVRKIGSEVTKFKVGDRVAGISDNMFTTLAVAPEDRFVAIPDDLGFDEASTMLSPLITAMYCLIDVGNLRKHQSVLIHSGCGGVGLAAIQLASMLEANIYVTVSSEEKVQHLMERFSVPRNRIFYSRDESFVAGLMRETQGGGVDLALNSLSGNLLHATWKCVAAFGKMVEIGKRDLMGRGRLDMSVFLQNRSYCCVDVGTFTSRMINRLLETTMDLIQKRNLAPVHPVKTFEASQVQDAFRYMQAGRHIGRIGVRIRDATGHLLLGSMGPHRPALTELDRNASYLVVGGLGGLGRATSVWMVEQGARSLIYLSRNVGAEENQFVRELEAMDCEVQIVRGSVECRGDVEKVIHKVKRPLKGILNMAMILRDDNFENMTLDQWNMVVGPKIQGTWNLHNATVSAGLDLDFFVLFSSLSGIIGQPGQTNYAAANSFLDAFVKFRRRQGLQASAIDLGAIQDIGYISRTPGLLQSLNQSGFRALREQEMLDAVALAMRPRETSPATTAPNARFLEDSSTFIVGLRSKVPLDSPSNRVVWKNDRRMAIYFNDTSTTNQQTSSSSDALKLFITSCRSDPSLLSNPDSASFIGREIGKKLLALLLKPQSDEINLGLSLADLGMDSLVAIELKGWWRGVFGFAISVLEMMGAGNLRTLGEIAVSGLGRAMESESVEANGSS